jgi:uncharacterized membrane protein
VGLLVLVTGGFQTAPAVSRRGLLWSSPGLRPAPPGCAIFRALSLGQAAEVAPVEKISRPGRAVGGAVPERAAHGAGVIGILLITSGVTLIAVRPAG